MAQIRNAPDTIPIEDLPLWMRQARQGVDWGVLLVIGFSLIVGWSFFLQDGLPHTNASANHVYMAADYAAAFREGRLYPRWSAAALNGYGAPIPHYFPPGAALSAALIEVLFTNDTVQAVRLVYIAALCLAGAATYAFVLRWAGARAGILAGILYVYSPYVGMTAPHALGDLPGVVGLGLLPALLWGVNRLLVRNRPLDFMITALISAALVLTDPRVAVTGVVLVPGLALWHAFRQRKRAHALRPIFAALVGVCLASFYWMPALLEQDAVRWMPPAYEPLRLALRPAALFAPMQKVDLNELVTTPQFTLGLALVIFAIAGIAGMVLERKWRSLYTLFLFYGAGFTAVGLFLLPGETWLLGPMTLCWSIVGSAAMLTLNRLPVRSKPTLSHLSLPVLTALMLTLSLPVWLHPLWPESFGDIGAYTQILHEQQGFGVAVLPPGTPIPVTLPNETPQNRTLINGYRTGSVMRLSQSHIRTGSLLAGRPHSDRYLMNTTVPEVYEVWRAYFPGWQATLNNDHIPISVDAATGLMAVSLPAVRSGNLVISLESTPIRRTAWGISWFTLLLLCLRTLRHLRNEKDSHHYDDLEILPDEEARLLMLVFIGFMFIVLLFARPISAYTLHARPGYALDNTLEIRSRTNVGLEALSYQLARTEYHIGESLDFFISWRTARTLLNNYSVRVFLSDSNSNIRWEQTEPQYPGGYPTRRWMANRYVRDDHRIRLTSNLTPGTYRIGVEVYDCNPECLPEGRVNFFSTDGQLIGQTLLLPSVITVKP